MRLYKMRTQQVWCVLLACLGPAHAQFLLNDLSFGGGARIAPVGETKVPGFTLQGQPAIPEILSDKLILTPPAPGGYRGAIWSEKTLDYDNWIIDVDFRTSGPERGSGNMNIWLAQNGESTVGAASIYTAGKFEGLALVVDQYGGSGMIRGFLNDGTSDFKTLNSDGRAFGQCYQGYRNLGRPMQIKLRQTRDNFKVEVDGRVCFESDKVSIPAGYQLGLTAATSDNPDSFEVFKVTAMTSDIKATTQAREQGYAARAQVTKEWHDEQRDNQAAAAEAAAAAAQQGDGQGQSRQQNPFSEVNSDGQFKDEIADVDAEQITSSKAQFTDLHARIQGISHHISTMYRSQHEGARAMEARFAQVLAQIGEVKDVLQVRLEKLDKLDALEQRAAMVERELKDLRGETARKIKDSEMSVKGQLTGAHDHLAEHIKVHAAPGHGKLILVIVASQVLLVVGFVVYKRRKNSMPKKYL